MMELASVKTPSGRVSLAFQRDPDGRTFLRRQYATHPFHICRALYHDTAVPGLATIYLQSCSGGLYEDEDLEIKLVAGNGAEACLTTQSATIVHSMTEGMAHQRTVIDAQADCYFEYLPDPQILFPASRCRTSIDVTLTPGAVVLVSDSFMPHNPDNRDGAFNFYSSRISISDGTRLLAVDRLDLDGAKFRTAWIGTSGRFDAQGTLIIAALQAPPASALDSLLQLEFDYAEAVLAASCLPNNSGIIVRILARDGATLKNAMHLTWCAARLAIKGGIPQERRK